MLERFWKPSRRCDLAKIAKPGDEVTIWNLGSVYRGRWAVLRAATGGLGQWLTCRALAGRRWTFLRACLETWGARVAAWAQGPELCRQIRAGEIDRVACFAQKGFGLARFLAAELGTPCDEQLARGTQYFGEFSFELFAVVPYAYWLHENGRLEFTVSTADTRCLYYFSRSHEERPHPRSLVPATEYPVWPLERQQWRRLGIPSTLDTRQWLPPPYREIYRGDIFRWPKEPCIVCNKTSDELFLKQGWVVNSMDTDLLLEVIGKLRSRYQVVYNRPRSSDIVNDKQVVLESGDIEAVREAYPDVLTIQELHARHSDLSFNELQLRLFASCERFVSVQGGSAYLASYFGGRNVVYARRGPEVSCGAYSNWFHRLSGARVVAAGTPRDLVQTIEQELL